MRRSLKSKIYYFLTKPFLQKEIKVSDCRTIFGKRFDSEHHLVKSLNEGKESSSVPTTLLNYHQNFCPQTMEEAMLGIANGKLPVFEYPWGNFSKRARIALKDVLKSRFCGPSDMSLVEAEWTQVLKLYRTIQSEGFAPWEYVGGAIEGTFLKNERGERVFVVLQGNHRLSVLVALGYEKVSVRMEPRNHYGELTWRDVRRMSRVDDHVLARRLFEAFF